MDTALTSPPPPQARRVRKPPGPQPVPIAPDDPLLGYQGIADLLAELNGKPIVVSTVRTFKRVGTLPVPDVQAGGEEYADGETIKSYHHKTREPKPADPDRPWTVRERKGSSNSWLRSTIVAWNATRRGPGRWKGSSDD